MNRADVRTPERLQLLAEAHATDLARAVEELAAMRARASAFAEQLDQALQRTVALEDTLARRDTHILVLKAQLDGTHRVAQSLRMTVETLQRSTSWRITRPLRALRRPGRSLRVLLGGKPPADPD